MKNKTKSVKSTRRSQKGKWGHVGAPPKHTSWPKAAFTMATLFNRNKNQCELSLRTKVENGVKLGVILPLIPKRQPGGGVGRPKSMFVLKEYFIPSKMELAMRAVRMFAPQPTTVVLTATPPAPMDRRTGLTPPVVSSAS